MRAWALVLAIAGGSLVLAALLLGAFLIKPESQRYQEAEYDFIGPGIRRLIRDQQLVNYGVAFGAGLQFVSVVLSALADRS